MQLPVALIATALLLAGANAAEPMARGEVAAIEVRLFLAYTGTFSEPIHEGTTLWNAVIGEGDLSEPSSSTFVRIQIQGKPKTYAKGQSVALKVTSEGPKKSTTRQLST